MDTVPSRLIALLGVDVSARAMKRLRAGSLTLDLDGGVLRHIRVKGAEAIRAIALIDDRRGVETPLPLLENMKVGQGPKGFHVSFDVIFEHADSALRCRVEVRGLSDGTLVFQVVGKMGAGLSTFGIGFVVAYPSSELVGRSVRLEALDGSKSSDVFPEVPHPAPLFRGLRALTFETVPGVDVTCRMPSRGFDVEDLRNDGVPCFGAFPSEPRNSKAGEVLEQSMTVSVSDSMRTVIGDVDR